MGDSALVKGFHVSLSPRLVRHVVGKMRDSSNASRNSLQWVIPNRASSDLLTQIMPQSPIILEEIIPIVTQDDISNSTINSSMEDSGTSLEQVSPYIAADIKTPTVNDAVAVSHKDAMPMKIMEGKKERLAEVKFEGDILLQQEKSESENLVALANGIIAREHRPSRQTIPCRKEYSDLLQCYRTESEPFKCGMFVNRMTQCVANNGPKS